MSAPEPLGHRVEGEGSNVVLLNGGMMSFPAWEPVAARLRARHRVLLFDFRGQLLSPGEGPANLSGHADDLAALLDSLGWDAAHLIGASFGAEVALHFAARQPQRVSSLVAVTAMDCETGEFRRQSEEMRAVLAQVLAGGERGRFYDVLVEGVYSEAYRRAEASAIAARRAQVDQLPLAWFAGVDRLLAAMWGFDLTAALPAIRCPALVVLSGDDRVMAAGRGRALATVLGAETVVHPTSGHALVAEDPEWLAGVCLEFLAAREEGQS
jgi:pimeloyl-ACP methyl ester carboxylesterase